MDFKSRFQNRISIVGKTGAHHDVSGGNNAGSGANSAAASPKHGRRAQQKVSTPPQSALNSSRPPAIDTTSNWDNRSRNATIGTGPGSPRSPQVLHRQKSQFHDHDPSLDLSWHQVDAMTPSAPASASPVPQQQQQGYNDTSARASAASPAARRDRDRTYLTPPASQQQQQQQRLPTTTAGASFWGDEASYTIPGIAMPTYSATSPKPAYASSAENAASPRRKPSAQKLMELGDQITYREYVPTRGTSASYGSGNGSGAALNHSSSNNSYLNNSNALERPRPGGIFSNVPYTMPNSQPYSTMPSMTRGASYSASSNSHHNADIWKNHDFSASPLGVYRQTSVNPAANPFGTASLDKQYRNSGYDDASPRDEAPVYNAASAAQGRRSRSKAPPKESTIYEVPETSSYTSEHPSQHQQQQKAVSSRRNAEKAALAPTKKNTPTNGVRQQLNTAPTKPAAVAGRRAAAVRKSGSADVHSASSHEEAYVPQWQRRQQESKHYESKHYPNNHHQKHGYNDDEEEEEDDYDPYPVDRHHKQQQQHHEAQQHRHVQYKPYTIEEYKSLPKVVRGPLGADMENEELRAKQQRLSLVRQLSQQIRDDNMRRLSSLHHHHNAQEEKHKRETARDRAIEFAKHVPKPKVVRQESLPNETSPTNTTSNLKGTSELSLKQLDHRHELARKNIESLRMEIAT